MVIDLRSYPLSTQNSRVTNLAGDGDTTRPPLTGSVGTGDADIRSDLDQLIEQAYRQIFFHAMQSDRDPNLESQLRSGTITMRDFIRGLLLSERFQQGYFQCSSNYRMVDQVVGRVLGRPVYGEGERLAWSILIAEKGFTAFVDGLLDSDEYLQAFGYDQLPRQRGRVIPGQAIGEIPIYQRFPRYGSDWRDAQTSRGCSTSSAQLNEAAISSTWSNGQPPAWALRLWLGLAVIGGFEVGRVILTIAVEMLRT